MPANHESLKAAMKYLYRKSNRDNLRFSDHVMMRKPRPRHDALKEAMKHAR